MWTIGGGLVRRWLIRRPKKKEKAAQVPDGALNNAEREHILRVLDEVGGIIDGPAGAARRLGLTRASLELKMRKFGIDARDSHRA